MPSLVTITFTVLGYCNIFFCCCCSDLFILFLQVVDEIVNSVSHCLVTLKCPSKKKKKQHKVAFMELSSAEPFESSESGKCLPLSDCLTASVDVERLYNGCLLDLVCNICTLCLDETTQNNSLVHLKLLSSLVPDFTSTKLIKTLLKNSIGQPTICLAPENDNYPVLSEQFLRHSLFPWIKSSFPETENDSCVFKDSRSVDYLIAILCGIITTLPLVKQVELVSESLQVSCLNFCCCTYTTVHV